VRGVEHPLPSNAEVKEKIIFLTLLPLSTFVTISRVEFKLIITFSTRATFYCNQRNEIGKHGWQQDGNV
jgi:hypothetical protein